MTIRVENSLPGLERKICTSCEGQSAKQPRSRVSSERAVRSKTERRAVEAKESGTRSTMACFERGSMSPSARPHAYSRSSSLWPQSKSAIPLDANAGFKRSETHAPTNGISEALRPSGSGQKWTS